ncbi:hypothetical protein EU803_14895 [Loktanella sp. IMCC34160]|uniref:conjugal transfer protein TraN n=1 Tax=Loktanella sp. IMCC34160 TaxID=2510646 RepID=UPI00101D3D5F|nr:conjugal transfer protein TraN [Loktanella sp. IMCC34160]RYG89908.1 hypothetical protein EU803_14895 [Loktanella sp. IMCC34160]
MRRLLSAAIVSLVAGTASADLCQLSGVECLARGSVEVGGVLIEDVCLEVQKVESCTRETPANSCASIEPLAEAPSDPLLDGQCRLVEETCLRSVGGTCDKWGRTYECWNAASLMGEAALEDRQIRNLDEQLVSTCAAVEADPECSYRDSVTTAGFGTRNINAHEVTRSWWQKEYRYDCSTAAREDTCGELEASPICRVAADYGCFAYAADGTCETQALAYVCESDASFEAQCAAVEVCEGENCEGAAEEYSEDYTEAAAWLNFLDQAAEDNACDATRNPEDGEEITRALCEGGTEEVCTIKVIPFTGQSVEVCEEVPIATHIEPEVFTGQLMSCTRGLTNCCDFDRQGSCSPEEDLLADYRQAGITHHVENRCTGWLLGACIRVEEYYCAYNSKFGRVFQEQADPLLGGTQFDRRGTPPCPGLRIDQLGTIDVGQMDLSEVFGDMLDQTTEPVMDLVIDRLSQEMGVFQLDVENTLGGTSP